MERKVIKIPYEPTEVQMNLHNDPHRYKVVIFGRRSGKSTYSLNEAIKVCLQKNGAKVWIVAPTFMQAKDIYWRDTNMVNKFIVPEVVKKMNDSEMLVQFINGSILQFKGSENKDALVGSGLDLVILDECAKMREIEDIWENKLTPALSDKNGKAIFITTPQGYDYIYHLYEEGQKKTGEWKSWRIPTWESKVPWVLTKVGQAEIERLRNDMNEDAFMQEYGADFRTHTGLVFKEFDRKIHVKDFEVSETMMLEAGIDFGFTNPTAVIFTYWDNDENLYIIDEYYEAGKSLADSAGRILAIRFKYPNSLRAVWGDSENPQIISEYAKFQLYISAVIKTRDSITIGIDKIRNLLKKNPVTNKPKLFVHPRCKNMIMEFERYRWKERQADLNFKDTPEAAYDHLVDALRYVILNHRRVEMNKEIAEPMNFGYKPLGGFNF